MHGLSFSHHQTNSHATQTPKDNACVCVCVCVCVVVCVVDKPTATVHVDFKKCMRPESACKSTAEDVTQHTTEVLRYRAPLPGLWSDEHPRKTSIEARKYFDGPQSPVPQGECAVLNARMYAKHGYQAASLLGASVHDSAFSLRQSAHRHF